MALKWPDKDPDEQLDYSVDWENALGLNTISSVTWKVRDADGNLETWTDAEIVNGLQRVSATNTTTVATIVLGSGIAFTTYKITCAVTASDQTQLEQEIRLRVIESR